MIFLLRHTAFRKGKRDGIPSTDATTEKARAVVLWTYSELLAWSISRRMVKIMCARPATFERLEMILQPSTQTKVIRQSKKSTKWCN